MTDDREKEQLRETEETIIDGPKRVTLHGGDVADTLKVNPETGMQKEYVVLSDAERANGFVRPVRDGYVHVGKRPKYPTRELTVEEKERYGGDRDGAFILYEEFPSELAPRKGRFWTKKELESGCGTRTLMNIKFAETYARVPKFYSGTFCAGCREHFDVGENGEFVWDGTDIRVGT
jgi:hypothetical protein